MLILLTGGKTADWLLSEANATAQSKQTVVIKSVKCL